MNICINQLLINYQNYIEKKITIYGWIRSFRSNQFLHINDGSSIRNIQIIINYKNFSLQILKKLNVGASVKIYGLVKISLGSRQDIEIIAEQINIIGEVDNNEIQKTILQPKKHSLEQLRKQAHLRFRTNTFSSIMRIRSKLAFAIHNFFNQKNFFYINTPIITSSNAEGAGDMFQVTSLNLNKPLPKNKNNLVDFTKDFFGKASYLTVSGQLEGELAMMGLNKIYTFGPTFRAENSNTTRHLSEFWMIEPEIAFYELEDNMNLAEELLKYSIHYILQNCQLDLVFLNDRLKKEKNNQKNSYKFHLIDKLNFIINTKFQRINYNEVINILKKSNKNKKKKFKFPITKWGIDLQSEHERFLVEEYFHTPVIIYDYPEQNKAFYMRVNDDQKTVRAMDVLFPEIGEIIGGSQREERFEFLKEKMYRFNINIQQLYWYLDTRRFGSVPHSGFGLGFDRLVLFITGMNNIRDVIPFPRSPKNADF